MNVEMRDALPHQRLRVVPVHFYSEYADSYEGLSKLLAQQQVKCLERFHVREEVGCKAAAT